MRSVNNLLEKFHQSFFLYLLCSPSKFVSVGLYMIPLGLLLVTLPLGAAALNSALEKVKEIGPGSDSRVSNLGATEGSVPKHAATKNVEESIRLLDIKTTKENAGRWRHAILVVSAVQLWAFIVALFPPVASSVVDMLATSLASTGTTPVGGFTSASLKMSLWAVVAALSLFVVLTSLPVAKAGDWMAVKALGLGIATIGLVVMSQVDFAVSMMGAVVLVPTCLCPSPLRDMWRGFTIQGQQKERSMLSRVSSFLGTMVTFLGSPPVLLAAAAVLLANAHGQVSLERLWRWTELLWSGGSALYIFVVAVYLPSSYLSLHVLFS